MKTELLKAELDCFVRAYHYRSSLCRVFSDEFAGRLLGENYDVIVRLITEELISDSDALNSDREALFEQWMRLFSSEILARAAFCEAALENATRLGCRQYINIGAGFDTYFCRCNIRGMRIIEADIPEVLNEKKALLNSCGEDGTRAEYFTISEDIKETADMISEYGFGSEQGMFVSLLNISGSLSRTELFLILRSVSDKLPSGGSVVFRYRGMAGNGRSGKFAIDYGEAEKMLSECGLRIYELLNGEEAEKRFFTAHNRLEPADAFCLPESLRFCLAVKK